MVQPSRQMECVDFLIHSEEIHKTYILYRPYWIEIMVFWGSTLKSNISMSECSAEHFRLITSVLDFGKGQWLARCQRVGRRFHAIMPLLRVVGNKPMTNRKLMTNPWDTFFRGPKPSDRKIGIGPKMSLSNAWPYWLICQTNSGWIPNVNLPTEFWRWMLSSLDSPGLYGLQTNPK